MTKQPKNLLETVGMVVSVSAIGFVVVYFAFKAAGCY